MNNIELDSDYGKFSIILKCVLAKRNITQGELAKQVGLSGATITNYINGKSTPTQKNLSKIADFLGVPPRIFYGNVNDCISYLGESKNRFAEKLDKLVSGRNITQEEFASDIGVSRQTVNMYVNGKQYPSQAVMGKIAEYFGVTIEELTENPKENESMRIYVTRMPEDKHECVFYEESKCGFGCPCDLINGHCSHLAVLDA